MGPIVCMISDGRSAEPGGDDRLIGRVRDAAAAGVDLVQIRERDRDDGALLALTRRCVDAVRATRTRILVNERADIALAGGAHGVHLRAASLPAWRVRPHVPRGFLIGRSVHDLTATDGAERDGALDYLIFGTVFESASKPGHAPSGVAALQSIVRATTLPVLAVGGVTSAQLGQVARTGAAGWAAIGVFGASREVLQVAMREGTLAFDTPQRVP